MHPINVLPEANIQAKGPVSEQFLRRGITSFRAACDWVKAMPYGANTNSEDSLILFQEEQGTCTTKHGAIARLAQEHNLPVHKALGFYRLNDEIVTGVNALLEPSGLSFIPQIHCFLIYQDYRVDLTEGNCNGKNKTIEDYDFVVQVQPDLTYAQKEAYYLDHLRRYYTIAPRLAEFGEAHVLELLSACDRQVKYQCSLMANRPVVV
ncbi:MAG: hypothetical protein AAFQ89_24285 [Cyanobacteria bacterium J06626_18]